MPIDASAVKWDEPTPDINSIQWDTPAVSPTDYQFIIRPDYPTALNYLLSLCEVVAERPTPIAVDIETRAGHTACVGLAWSDTHAICLPLMCAERAEGYWSLDEEAQITFLLYKLLTHPNCEVIGQNFSYDAQYFWRHMHFLPNLKRDTMLASIAATPSGTST